MGDWVTAPLAEVLDFREGPGIMASDFRESGVPLVRLAGLKRGADLLDGCNFLDADMVARKWAHFRLRQGDVVLSTSASLGEVATVSARGAGAVPYTGIIAFRPAGPEIDPRLIPHLLTAPSFKAQIEAMGVGSVMKHFGPSHLRKMSVTYPTSRRVQAGIAQVLAALDDKIAANRDVVDRCNDLARAYWESAAAEAAPLSSLARFVNGRPFTKGASGTGRVVVRIAELNSGLGASTVRNDIDVADDHLARPGDLLFAWSGSLTVARWYRPEAIINQHIFKVIPNDGMPMWLVDQALRAKLEDYRAIAADKATTMGHIQRAHLDQPVLIPPPAEIERLDPVMQSLWERALAAETETLQLERTRDELLPLLMSGSVHVRDLPEELTEVERR